MNEVIDTSDVLATDGHIGIFTAIAAQYDETPDWMSDTWSLDVDYHIGRSAEKYIGPIPSVLVDQHNDTIYEGQLIAGDFEKLSQIIFNKYAANWDKLYAAYMAEYNPIQNYSMTEEGTDTLTKSGTEENSEVITKAIEYEDVRSGTNTDTNTIEGRHNSNTTQINIKLKASSVDFS